MKFKKPIDLSLIDEEIPTFAYIFQNGAGCYRFETVKAVTVVFIFNEDLSAYAGVSACSVLDEYDVNLGLIKAHGRAKSKRAAYCLKTGASGNSTTGLIEDPASVAEHIAIETAKRIDRRNKKKYNKRVNKEMLDAFYERIRKTIENRPSLQIDWKFDYPKDCPYSDDQRLDNLTTLE